MMTDKLLHFIAGAVIAFPAAMFLGEVWGVLIAAGAGVLKEMRDEWAYGGFDWRDLMATWAGALVGVALAGVVA